MEQIKFTLATAKRIKDARIDIGGGKHFDLFGNPSEFIPILFYDPVVLAQVWKAIHDDRRPLDAYLATLDGQDLTEHANAFLEGLPSFSSLPHLKRVMADLYREKIRKVMAERNEVARILSGGQSGADSPSPDTAPNCGA